MFHVFTFSNYGTVFYQCIHRAKQNYLKKVSKKPIDPMINTKCFRSLLKTLLHETKILSIPIIFYNKKHLIDLQKRVKTITLFFLDNISLYLTKGI